MPAARNTKAAIRAYAAENNCTYTAAKRVLDRRWDDTVTEAAVGSFGEPTLEQLLYVRLKTGAQRLYGSTLPEPVRQRLSDEYRLIREMGQTDYILAIHDIITWARGRQIAVSPGVGASTASLALYCLGVTLVDPIRYDLPSHRFLSPRRQWLIFSTEVAASRVKEVFDYACAQYGPIEFDLRGSHALDAIGTTAAAVGESITQLLSGSFAERPDASRVWRHLTGVGTWQPQSISDVADGVASQNPAAADSVMEYTRRRRANDRRGALTAITDDPGELDIIGSVLDDTYGVVMYREQIAHLAEAVAGYTGQEQETLSIAILKKVPTLDQYQAKFVVAATDWGRRFRFKTAAALFEHMAGAAPRLYARTHALGQAQQLFADAYLRVHHPAEHGSAVTQE